eukprot:scaffold16282_cov77-Skeletonema_dohrnii-CCMP3373.AAC.3
MASTHIIIDRAERRMMDAMVESYLQHSRSSLHELADLIMMDEDGRACTACSTSSGSVKSIMFNHDRMILMSEEQGHGVRFLTPQ